MESNRRLADSSHEVLEAILQRGKSERKLVKFHYKSMRPGPEKYSIRLLEVYDLDSKYVSGFCHLAQDKRTFKLERIQGMVSLLDLSFPEKRDSAQFRLEVYEKYGAYMRRPKTKARKPISRKTVQVNPDEVSIIEEVYIPTQDNEEVSAEELAFLSALDKGDKKDEKVERKEEKSVPTQEIESPTAINIEIPNDSDPSLANAGTNTNSLVFWFLLIFAGIVVIIGLS